MLPLYIENIQFHFFLISLISVIVVLRGFYVSWGFFARRLDIAPPFLSGSVASITAILSIPLLLFPIQLFFAYKGLHRPITLFLQFGFGTLGFFSLLRFLRSLRWSFVRENYFSIPSCVCMLSVALFVYWPFVMPYGESFNGHHHTLINMVYSFWHLGSYETIPLERVFYDNSIFVWPPNLSFFLALFSLSAVESIGFHPVFLLPGIVSLFVWHAFRRAALLLDTEKNVGDVAFLLIAFSYYTVADFTSLSFDLLSPLMCGYFLCLLIEFFKLKNIKSIPFFMLVLSLSFLVRKQFFLLFGVMFVSIVVLAWRNKYNFKEIFQGKFCLLVIIFCFPSLVWALHQLVVYGSPFFPHDNSITAMLFKPREISLAPLLDMPRGQEQGYWAMLANKLTTYKKQTGNNFYVEHFFPMFCRSSLMVTLKNIFLGLSNSTVLTFSALTFIIRENLSGLKTRYGVYVFYVVLFAYLFVGVIFFPAYPKYPHYAAFLFAIFAAIFLKKYLFKDFHIFTAGISVVLFAFGVYSWAFNIWGHSFRDYTFQNIYFLSSRYGAAADRISRVTSRPADDIVREIAELELATHAIRDKKERILYMEHEPGLLVPSILNNDFFATVLFYENYVTRDVFLAKNKVDLVHALCSHNIKYVYMPQRDHGVFEDTLLIKILRAYNGNWKYVIPISEIL